MSKHPIVHVEFSAQSHQEAARFYSSVFGWETQEFPEMDYTTFSTGGDAGGGFNPISEDNPAGRVMVYIGCDDIPATLAKIEANGGTVLVREFEVPGQGWMATFTDPTGNLVSLWKSVPAE